jgi:hypothetical protein
VPDTLRTGAGEPVVPTTHPEHGTVYIEITTARLSELTQVPVAKVLKVNHYYPERGTTSWSDFDRKTWIARLGMTTDATADQQVGVVADGLPPVLTASVVVEGKLQRLDRNSLLGVRVDYQVDGKYVKGTLFHGPRQGVTSSTEANAVVPGTESLADEVVKVNDLASFQLTCARTRPRAGGKAHITYLQNAGVGTCA